MSTPVTVVVAVVLDGSAVLLQLRAPHREFPLTWECPGGKVEGNESDADALRRELQEELHVGPGDVHINALLFQHLFEPPITQVPCFLKFYAVSFPFNQHRQTRMVLNVNDGLAYGFFAPEALPHVKLTPGNEACFKHLGWLP